MEHYIYIYIYIYTHIHIMDIGHRGWIGWITSLIQWTCTWANSRNTEGQGGLVCRNQWDCKEMDPTQWMNSNNKFSINVISVAVQSLSHVQLCDSVDCSTPSFLVLYHLLGLAQIHVHWVCDTIQPSHPLLSPFSSCLQSFPASGYFLMS